MAVSVRIENLVKYFGGTHAVDHITLTVQPGDIYFLLGPSGCGKTTLLRCIAGFYEPEDGRILIGDEDVTRTPPHQRDTGMVFQSYALWPHMTVRENVAFGLEQRRVSREDIRRRADEALRMVHMTDRADHRPNQLSGGQQQRVALARALVIHPKCLLLDEPLSNLDAKLRMEMRSEIRRICKSAGLTAIYVTHDQKEALSVADELAILDKGKIEQSGAPRDVYLRPANRFVANFIGETNFLEGDLAPGGGDGRRVVRTACGDIVSAALPPDLPAAGRVTLSIRPETIRLGPAPADAPNAFRGWLHDTVYLGETAQHQLQAAPAPGAAAEGPSFKVFELNPRTVARDNAREEIRFWVAPEDVVVLVQ